MKIMIKFFTAVLLSLSFSLSLLAQDITLSRYPAISPDGQTIAFSFQGDIWVKDLAGDYPRRLTIHEAYESNPVFSPDGLQLAFNSSRYGQNDVFVVSVYGGVPKRLTYHASGDQLSDWTNDNRLLFSTRRAYAQIERDSEVYETSVSGGTPTRYLDALGQMATLSADGRYVAFVKGACRVAREAYKGPADLEIWIYDTRKDEYIPVTNNETNDYMPRWGEDNELYYISSINGVYNLVKVDASGKEFEPKVVTTYTDDGVRSYDVTAGAVVYERGTSIYILKSDSEPAVLDLNISADYRFDPVEIKTFSNGIGEYEVSPNGKYALMGIRGEIFVQELDKEKSRTVNLSNHPYRDRDAVWLNDSVALFVSDREGQYDIYLARSSDKDKPNLYKSLKHELVKITKTPESETGLSISPDGKKLSYLRGNGQLVVTDISAQGQLTNEKVLLDGWDEPGGVQWSPDSRYVAYHQSDLNFNSEVFILAVDGASDPINISMHPRGDYSPYWSKDGSKIGFTSSRNNGDRDLWFVWLQKEDWLKTKEDRDDGYYFADPEPEAEKSDTTKDSKDKKKKDKVEALVIDFEGIYDRLEQVTSMPGDESAMLISDDGETFYFTASGNTSRGRDLYQVQFDGSEISNLTSGGTNPYGLSLSPDGKEIVYIKRGGIEQIDPSNKKTTSFPHKAVMKIDMTQERAQIFDEAWQSLNDNFYDPDFHGNDWNSLKAKYKPWALSASTTQDFRYMFNLMLGQLNASHMGMYGPDPEDVNREVAGLLGVEFNKNEDGDLQIAKVVPNTPADRSKSKLVVGDQILSVDGMTVAADLNIYSLLVEKTGDQVLLEVADAEGAKREIVIRPTRSIRTELYEEWISSRQKLTEQYSNGRLGYIHIRGMDKPSFERFERELMASGQGKEGIVIDVRFNGGGWTTDYLMAVLTVRQHAYTVPRGATTDLKNNAKSFSEYYPYSERLPLSSWVKPSVAMCNESSYSNAEIFSHAYKNLGIGTLVGKPTFGAVISTGGTGLLDGSLVRMPFRGWYVKATDENMENGPAVPDVIVDNAPGEKAQDKDTQLKAAVEVLLMDISQGAGDK